MTPLPLFSFSRFVTHVVSRDCFRSTG